MSRLTAKDEAGTTINHLDVTPCEDAAADCKKQTFEFTVSLGAGESYQQIELVVPYYGDEDPPLSASYIASYALVVGEEPVIDSKIIRKEKSS